MFSLTRLRVMSRTPPCARSPPHTAAPRSIARAHERETVCTDTACTSVRKKSRREGVKSLSMDSQPVIVMATQLRETAGLRLG